MALADRAMIALTGAVAFFLVALVPWSDAWGPLPATGYAILFGVGCALAGPPAVQRVRRWWERRRPGLAVASPGTVRDLSTGLAGTALPAWHDAARRAGLWPC